MMESIVFPRTLVTTSWGDLYTGHDVPDFRMSITPPMSIARRCEYCGRGNRLERLACESCGAPLPFKEVQDEG
jgi:hypothetical protein